MANSPRILLVDDEPDLLDLMELTLTKMGLETDRAESVAEARNRLSQTEMRIRDANNPHFASPSGQAVVETLDS